MKTTDNGQQTTDQVLKDIKKELRASMNGILSARMREAGIPFKLIFGVELPRLQNIAAEFSQDVELAQQLWSQNIRETRLLAIMLMPVEAFTSEVANSWAETLLTAEETQVLAMLLLSKAKHAKATCLSWLNTGKSLPSVCACLCLRRMLVQGTKLEQKEAEIIEESTTKMLPTANLHLRKAIQTLKEALYAK